MRKLLLTTVIAALPLVPAVAYAQQAPVVLVENSVAAENGLDAGEIIAIAAGAVIGATVFSSALTFRGATLLGAVAGGAIGSWWYGDRSDIAPLDSRKKIP
jgi:uncharacterized protein YcfJ